MNGQPKPAQGKYGPIEIFRSGQFLDSTNRPQTITDDNLRQIASGYDKSLHPAPVVIGHPDMDAPAYGWVEHLYVENSKLKATLEETEPAFAEMVNAGRYKRVSISIYSPDSAHNPKPGNIYIKHVGFLGAAAPAVPGLKPVRFAGGGAGALTMTQDNTWNSFGDEPELVRLRREAREFQVEKLITAGRVLPCFKDEVLAFSASLDDTETVSFSEGQTATRKDWFLSYLARQPKVVSFGAMDLGPDLTDMPQRRQHQNIPDGFQVDRRNDNLFFTAQMIAREKGISFADAVDLAMDGPR